MGASYGESQRKYYKKNKDSIYRRTLKYKTAYNKRYYEENSEIINQKKREKVFKDKAAELKKIEDSLYKTPETP